MVLNDASRYHGLNWLFLNTNHHLKLYLVENFKHSFDMERWLQQSRVHIILFNPPSYVYYTQVMQAETLASAYRLWRRNWRGPGREYTAGALVWQVREQEYKHSFVKHFNRSMTAGQSPPGQLSTISWGLSRRILPLLENFARSPLGWLARIIRSSRMNDRLPNFPSRQSSRYGAPIVP